MNTVFLCLLIILMLVRLPYIHDDKKISEKQIIYMLILQILGLLILLKIENVWYFFLAVIIVLNIIVILCEYKITDEKKRKYGRLTTFFLFLITFSVFTSPGINLRLNKSIILGIFEFLDKYSSLFSKDSDWRSWQILFSGLLFLLTETNLFIRSFFDLFDITSTSNKNTKDDNSNINAGRIIGLLERVIIYFALISGQPTLAGFVITAKGIIRFNQKEERPKAEYILIGTLLSVCIAILISLITKTLGDCATSFL